MYQHASETFQWHTADSLPLTIAAASLNGNLLAVEGCSDENSVFPAVQVLSHFLAT